MESALTDNKRGQFLCIFYFKWISELITHQKQMSKISCVTLDQMSNEIFAL